MVNHTGQFNKDNFQLLCNAIGKRDRHLKAIIQTHGYPPMWTRPPSFPTLVLIILEQQVSLASARAAFNKLKEKIGSITPKKVLSLSDAELRACYFSRQKTVYARHLAELIVTGQLNLKKIGILPEIEIREVLKKVKGIGDWTVDVYLLFALQKTDVFPVGDLAMVNALKEIKKLPKDIHRDNIIKIAEPWRPYRSLAAMLLWHHYIKTRNIKF